VIGKGAKAEQSALLAGALQKANVKVDFQRVPATGHGDLLGKLDVNKVVAFFDEHLKANPSPQTNHAALETR
jgi:hypothetical protein